MVLDVNSGAVFANRMAADPRYADNNFVEPTLMPQLVARIQALVDVAPLHRQLRPRRAEGRPRDRAAAARSSTPSPARRNASTSSCR